MSSTLLHLRERLNLQLAEYSAAKAGVHAEKTRLRTAKSQVQAAQDALRIAQTVAQHVQQQVHARIAGIVSRALETVFDEPYEFVIRFVQRRGRTEAILELTRDEVTVDPMEACGGGVVDVAAFALRLSCLLLHQPPLRRLLVLDEPWKFLSAQFRPRMRALVESLSKELGVQFLIVTHEAEYRIGKVVEL